MEMIYQIGCIELEQPILQQNRMSVMQRLVDQLFACSRRKHLSFSGFVVVVLWLHRAWSLASFSCAHYVSWESPSFDMDLACLDTTGFWFSYLFMLIAVLSLLIIFPSSCWRSSSFNNPWLWHSVAFLGNSLGCLDLQLSFGAICLINWVCAREHACFEVESWNRRSWSSGRICFFWHLAGEQRWSSQTVLRPCRL